MITERQLQYFEQLAISRYKEEKERQRTNRLIAILVAITLISIFFIHAFFVVPVEEETLTADHGSQIVEASNIGGDNINGLQSKKN